MAVNLNRLTHKIVVQLHLVAESCTICSCCSRWPVRKLWDTPLYRTNKECGQEVITDPWRKYFLKFWKVKLSLCLTKYHTINMHSLL